MGCPLLLGAPPCSNSGGSGTPLSEGWLCLVCLAERLQDGGGCSLPSLSGYGDWAGGWGCFPGRSMGAGCSAAQASSWRVLNPWESPAGSNKHKQPKKPELMKPYLHHCLGKSHSCHSMSFSTLSCSKEVVWGTPKAGGPVPISGEGRFWRLTANLRLFEAEGRLLALAWDCSHVAPSVSWLAGATYSQSIWLLWVGFCPFFKGCFSS